MDSSLSIRKSMAKRKTRFVSDLHTRRKTRAQQEGRSHATEVGEDEKLENCITCERQPWSVSMTTRRGKKLSDCSVAPGRGGGVRAPWRGSAAPWARAALHTAAASSLGGTAASEECDFF
jgi:hypothetical protein